MKRVILLLVFAFTTGAAISQCNPYYALDEGSEWELESYNAKGKLTGKNHQKVVSFNESGDGYTAGIETTSYDHKGKALMTGQLEFKCAGGTMIIDMRNFVNEEQLKAFANADMKMETENLELPSSLSAGQTLKNGKIAITASGSAFPMKMTITISDRKVQAKESVTTPAGTFDSYKITSKMTMQNQMGVTINTEMSVTEWIAPKVGVVKSESYSKQGKLMGYTLLSRRAN